jgi:peptidoglycan/xylan/chitin deacetylase (PgdA/CDA1 family)
MAMSRRTFLAATAAAAISLPAFSSAKPQSAKASIAITLDLEMARNFPTWETTHWDYEKGNLNDATKKYAVEAARRVKAHGGVIHFFLVASVLEQENIDWLKELVAEGHLIGNHTYDHVYVRATEPADIQYKFKRAPWLVQGKPVPQVIAENVQLATAAIKTRLGIDPAGFRTPGGFADGLTDRPDVRKMLLDQGFKWVSSRYPAHAYGEAGKPVTEAVMADILRAQRDAQPFVYPDGLIEIPMSPISDIGAFRNGRWKLDEFLEITRRCVEQSIADGSVFDFLSHPAVLYAMDPQFRAIDLICDLTTKAGDRAKLVDLSTVASRMHPPK